MPKTLKATSTAIAANKANFANMGLASSAEADQVAKILAIIAARPTLAQQILSLIGEKNITEDK